MENITIPQPKKWYKKKKWWFVGAGVLLLVVWAIFFRGSAKPTYETVDAKKVNLTQEVSVTGKVKPAQTVDLQFESSGRIGSINYKTGDKVRRGATIASLENQDLQAAVTSAQADLDKTKRNYESLSDASVYSSLRVELENSQTSLAQIKIKADSDLASDYNSAFNTMREAMTQIDTASTVLEYTRKTYLEAKDPWDSNIKQYQATINAKVAQIQISYPWLSQSGITVTPGLYGQIDSALQDLLSTYQSLRAAFTYLQGEIQSNYYLVSSSTDRTSINTQAATITSDLSSISGAIQDIADQKVTNNKNISDAEAKVATAKAAFPTNEDILQKQAALLSAQSQLRKTLVVAPFDGVVGKIDVERGQTVNSSTVIVSFISSAEYQLEANITEVDIAKIKIGDMANLTLDAYGSGVVMHATVSQIDTAETVIEGVTTYKTTLDFDGDIGVEVRPNMTANIDIQTARKDNVIAVPARSVISTDGEKVVRVLVNGVVEERKVEIGLHGSDGNVEVVSGINEGDNVITFSE